ncbi:hypothetical protein [Nonomuraea sp. NPDC049141]|uniref:hypothetical protein n=1 Tax=Nonomuraea sp. NPDC049141 TaxID=3155500 RepID=UPI00340B83A8
MWCAHNLYDQVGKLKGVELYVAAGAGDLVENLANRAARLAGLGIPVRTHFYRGGHDHASWRREPHRAYPMLTRAIGAP